MTRFWRGLIIHKSLIVVVSQISGEILNADFARTTQIGLVWQTAPQIMMQWLDSEQRWARGKTDDWVTSNEAHEKRYGKIAQKTLCNGSIHLNRWMDHSMCRYCTTEPGIKTSTLLREISSRSCLTVLPGCCVTKSAYLYSGPCTYTCK